LWQVPPREDEDESTQVSGTGVDIPVRTRRFQVRPSLVPVATFPVTDPVPVTVDPDEVAALKAEVL
jgi:hypothetical protein